MSDDATQPAWSLGRRIGFRIGFLFAALQIFPFPLNVIPGGDRLVPVLAAPFGWLAQALARGLGISMASVPDTGSGDTTESYVMLLLTTLLALGGAALWSAVDRRRRSHPRLARGLWIAMRYYLAACMLDYGSIKVVKAQFYDLSPGVLHYRLGDLPPMRLMWAFMGYSLPYTVFAGLAEVTGGLLLLWRRTALLGALLIAAVMTNVVLMNFCYDIPVKLFSSTLLAMALAILAPSARRLLRAVLGEATEATPAPPRASWRGRLTQAAMIALLVYPPVTGAAGRRAHDDHRHELYGNWQVDQFVLDGVEHPALPSDAARWETWSANPTYMQIWRMDGTFEGRYEQLTRGWYPIVVDPFARTVLVTLDDARAAQEVWRYQRPAPGALILDGVHRGRRFHVVAHRLPDGELLTRGFHWINEVPYNH